MTNNEQVNTETEPLADNNQVIVDEVSTKLSQQSYLDPKILDIKKYSKDDLGELTKEEIDNRIDLVLNEVGMVESKNLKPNELSGGMIKRVSIARAIAGKPNYLLYDEPTTGLDPLMVGTINNLMKKIHNEEKVTSIIVTHELKTIFNAISTHNSSRTANRRGRCRVLWKEEEIQPVRAPCATCPRGLGEALDGGGADSRPAVANTTSHLG